MFSETAMLSADYLWKFNPGLYVIFQYAVDVMDSSNSNFFQGNLFQSWILPNVEADSCCLILARAPKSSKIGDKGNFYVSVNLT